MIRIRGIPEFDQANVRDRHEQDMQEVLKVSTNLEIKAQVVDLKKSGIYKSERSRTITIKVSNFWGKRLSLFSVAKLRSFQQKLLVSRELTLSEVRIELESLKRRQKLVDEGIDRRRHRIEDFKLYQKKDDSWVEVKAQSAEASTSLDSETIMMKLILLYNVRSTLDIQRMLNFSNALQIQST